MTGRTVDAGHNVFPHNTIQTEEFLSKKGREKDPYKTPQRPL